MVEQVTQFKSANIDIVLGDLTIDITHTVNNVDKVIFAAGSGGKNVIELEQDGAKRLISGAKMTIINKFVMLSSMGADSPEAAGDLQAYMKAKQKADDHLINSGLNFVIVRLGA